MQPANVTLQIVQGATLRESLRVMQSQFEYRPISSIANAAPVQLTLVHGLPRDWPVWVVGVQGLSELNRAKNQTPHHATVIDADTLEINALSAAGRAGTGGLLVYHPPVDLTGATALVQILDEKGGELLEFAAVVHTEGWIDINLTAEQTEAIAWRKGVWQLDVTLPGGAVVRPFAGQALAVPPGTPALGITNAPTWVFTFGTQGPPGAGDVSELEARLDAQQQQIEELFALVGGGGETPVFVLSGTANVMSGDSFVVSSGAH